MTDSSPLLTDFGANFFKKVWVFLIEILGFFCFLVSSKILRSFSKLNFFRVSWEFLVSSEGMKQGFFHRASWGIKACLLML